MATVSVRNSSLWKNDNRVCVFNDRKIAATQATYEKRRLAVVRCRRVGASEMKRSLLNKRSQEYKAADESTEQGVDNPFPFFHSL